MSLLSLQINKNANLEKPRIPYNMLHKTESLKKSVYF